MDPLTGLRKDQDLTWARSYRKEVREEYRAGWVHGMLLGTVFGILITLWFVVANGNP